MGKEIKRRTTLFRPEAAIRQDDWLGRAVIILPPSMRWLCWIVVVFTIAALAFMASAEYTRRTAVSGVLKPGAGLIKVLAPASGVVLERRVSEGQAVNAGDILYIVSGERQYALEQSGQAGVTAEMLGKLDAQRALLEDDASQSATLAARERQQAAADVRDRQLELDQMDQEIAIQSERMQLKVAQYERHAQTHTQGFISASALQQRQEELLEHKARLQGMQRSRLGMARDLSQAKAKLESLAMQDALARSERKRQVLNVEQERVTHASKDRVLVTAPQGGVVAAALADVGQNVERQTLATLLPKDAYLEAHLFVPSASIGSMRAGDTVSLRFAAYPFQTYGALTGQVSAISLTTLDADELAAEGAAAKDMGPCYRVRVRLPAQALQHAGKQHLLRSGMQVEGQFAQERRTLLGWLLDPIYKLKDGV